jgi:hypothetical protein
LSADLGLLFLSVHSELKPRTPPPDISAEFFPYAGLTHTVRFRNNRLLIRISDVLWDAPEAILRSLAVLLLSRIFRQKADPFHLGRYRFYTLTDDIRERAREARRIRGRKPVHAVEHGHFHDLGTSFDRVNQEYFSARLEKPSLSWSRRRSRHILGRYDASHNTITISRVLDREAVPHWVVDYVMYHELLHARHQNRVEKHRLLSHTREFRLEESLFREYDRAKQWLRDHI